MPRCKEVNSYHPTLLFKKLFFTILHPLLQFVVNTLSDGTTTEFELCQQPHVVYFSSFFFFSSAIMKPILFLFCCLVQVLKSDAQFLDSDTCRSVSGSNVCLRQGPCGTQVQALQRYATVLYPTKNKLSCQLNGAATDFAQVNYKGSTGTWMAASYLGCCNSGVITSAPAWASKELLTLDL